MTDEIEIDDDLRDYLDGQDFCVACGAAEPHVGAFASCDGCGNAVCPACADEDDFGNVRCDPECGI